MRVQFSFFLSVFVATFSFADVRPNPMYSSEFAEFCTRAIPIPENEKVFALDRIFEALQHPQMKDGCFAQARYPNQYGVSEIRVGDDAWKASGIEITKYRYRTDPSDKFAIETTETPFYIAPTGRLAISRRSLAEDSIEDIYCYTHSDGSNLTKAFFRIHKNSHQLHRAVIEDQDSSGNRSRFACDLAALLESGPVPAEEGAEFRPKYAEMCSGTSPVTDANEKFLLDLQLVAAARAQNLNEFNETWIQGSPLFESRPVGIAGTSVVIRSWIYRDGETNRPLIFASSELGIIDVNFDEKSWYTSKENSDGLTICYQAPDRALYAFRIADRPTKRDGIVPQIVEIFGNRNRKARVYADSSGPAQWDVNRIIYAKSPDVERTETGPLVAESQSKYLPYASVGASFRW